MNNHENKGAGEKKPDYDVGYGKPPKHAQFAKGQSGNAKGRPKGSKNFSSTLEQELNVRIPVTENGKRKSISKREAIAKQIVNKSVAGDLKIFPLILNEIRQLESKTVSDWAPPEFTNQTAQDTINHALERFMRMENANKASNEGLSPPVQDIPQPTDKGDTHDA